MLHILFSLLCVKYIFFGFIEAFHSKRKDYVIGREILKLPVGSVTLELCDSRDYFASSLLVKRKPNKFIRDFEERKLLFIALVSNCSYRSCPDIS